MQDPLSFRVVPQVHGALREFTASARHAVEVELNSRSDNPLVSVADGAMVHNGNFHPIVLAIAFDALRIAVAHVGQLSERRIGHLWDAFFARSADVGDWQPGGTDEYFGLWLRYSAASQVAELKQLAAPATLDVPPLDMEIEDHATGAPLTVAKTAAALELLENILTIELLIARDVVSLSRRWIRLGRRHRDRSCGHSTRPSSHAPDDRTPADVHELVRERVAAPRQRLMRPHDESLASQPAPAAPSSTAGALPLAPVGGGPTPPLRALLPTPVVLACEMIEDEVRLVLDRVAAATGRRPPLVWIPAGLHERPERLRDHLQGLVDRLDAGAAAGEPVALASVRPGLGPADERAEEVIVPAGVTHVLLALGFCGNGLLDLRSQTLPLVFPRVDDCISLFLNDGGLREDIKRDARAFYFTRGWLDHDNPLLQSYDRWKELKGPEEALRFRKMSLRGYKRVTLIDTGAFPLDDAAPRTKELADELELDHAEVPGSLVLLERLLTGPWDSEVVVVRPGEAITIWHLLEPR